MSLPETYNLNIYRGDRYMHPFELTDREGAPIDLTNIQLSAVLVTDSGREEFVVNTPNVAGGEIEISLTGDRTSQLPNRSYWQLSGTNVDGHTETYIAGVARARGETSG